jgi:hypothetical protein
MNGAIGAGKVKRYREINSPVQNSRFPSASRVDAENAARLRAIGIPVTPNAKLGMESEQQSDLP